MWRLGIVPLYGMTVLSRQAGNGVDQGARIKDGARGQKEICPALRLPGQGGPGSDTSPMTQSFDPAQTDSRAFRDALGRFGTGVTVITCATSTGPLGITANSFSSVSLEPPLVLWAPAKSSSRYPFFMAAERFAIHVMGADQFDLCRAFARDGDAFAAFDWTQGDTGVPLIENCLARFECRQAAAHDAGDHSILLGHVERVTTNDGAPLLFHEGRYGSFAAN